MWALFHKSLETCCFWSQFYGKRVHHFSVEEEFQTNMGILIQYEVFINNFIRKLDSIVSIIFILRR